MCIRLTGCHDCDGNYVCQTEITEFSPEQGLAKPTCTQEQFVFYDTCLLRTCYDDIQKLRNIKDQQELDFNLK